MHLLTYKNDTKMIKKVFSRLIQWVKRGKVILAEVTFYNDDASVVLTQTFADGHHRHTLFEGTSQLVNHLNEHGIDVPQENIINL